LWQRKSFWEREPNGSSSRSKPPFTPDPNPYEHTFDTISVVAEFLLYELELLRRSVAMLPPGAPNRLSREKALVIISQLKEMTAGRYRFVEEVSQSGG
jgi:hypothetical protein